MIFLNSPILQDLERIASGIPIGTAPRDLESMSSNLNMLAISAISPIGSPGGAGELGGLGASPLSLPIGSPPGATATLSLAAAGPGSPRFAAKLASPAVSAAGGAVNGVPAPR